MEMELLKRIQIKRADETGIRKPLSFHKLVNRLKLGLLTIPSSVHPSLEPWAAWDRTQPPSPNQDKLLEADSMNGWKLLAELQMKN